MDVFFVGNLKSLKFQVKYFVEPFRGPEGYPKCVYSLKLRYRQVFVDPKWIQIG